MKRIFILITAIALMLSGCSSDTPTDSAGGDAYIDVDKLKSEYNETLDEGTVDSLEIDDHAHVFCGLGYYLTVSQNQLLMSSQESKKVIDLSSGNITSFCDIPGCAHDVNTSEGCLEYELLNSMTYTKDGIYYTDYKKPGKLFYKSGSKTDVVFENTYYNDKDKELEPGHETGFVFFIRGDTMYIRSLTYFYTVDMKTMEQTCEPVTLTDSPISNADTCGDYYYITNSNFELIAYNMKTATLKKYADKVLRIQACDDGLYYIKEGKSGLDIYFCDSDGENEVKLIEGVWPNMFVTDERIFYVKPDGLYVYDKKTKQSQQLELSLKYQNGEDYITQDFSLVTLFSCPSSDNIYFVDYALITGEKHMNALFVINKATLKTRAISLGIYDSSNGYFSGIGQIVTY